tara:strand:+ start:6716 stop:7129 length:414 start_codon:yes stop_codon:yes gene_type:complete
MKKSELKSIVKECIKEILFDEGVLSNLVAEVAVGITRAQGMVLENQHTEQAIANKESDLVREHQRKQKLMETKKKMLDAISDSKMQNVFEGTTPLREAGTPNQASPHSPLANRDPSDSGVDISGLFNMAGHKWNTLK